MYGIVYLFEAEVTDMLTEFQSKWKKHLLKPLFEKDTVPHVTVIQGPYSEHLFKDVTVAKEIKDTLAPVQDFAFGDFSTIDGYIHWGKVIVPGLQNVHEKLMNIVGPYRDTSRLRPSVPSSQAIIDKRNAYAAEYGSPFVFDCFVPHVTLGVAPRVPLELMTDYYQTFNDRAGTLIEPVLVDVGSHGSVREILHWYSDTK